MKHLIKILLLILVSLSYLGVDLPPDDNLYKVTLSEITVKASILEGFVPRRAKSWNQQEFIKLNKPIIEYLAKHTWLKPQQIYAMIRMEQGKGSYLLTKHNNPLNITASKGVIAQTWEYIPDNIVNGTFASYSTLKEGLEATVKLLNGKYYHEPTDDITACYHIYNKGWHTDPNVKGRIKLAKNYKQITCNEIRSV